MKLAIMQPYFFPYFGYFQLIHAVDAFIIYDDVHYINKGYINRNAILLNGCAHRITLALHQASQNKLIHDIETAHNSEEKILRTIALSYKKAPYFRSVFPMVDEILTHDEKNLTKFLRFSLERVMEYCDIHTSLLYSSEIDKDVTLKGQDKIFALCKQHKANTYINAIGGQQLYDKTSFNQQSIELKFLKPHLLTYSQFGGVFIPNLSIIDVLMFNSTSQIAKSLNQYSLISAG